MKAFKTIVSSFDWRIALFALLLIGGGITVDRYFHQFPIAFVTADAMIVAGILALGIDPLLKRHLLYEASRGIFVHLLGFEHHPQVKDKLKEIVFGTKILRPNINLRCEVAPQDRFFLFTVEYDAEIINPTDIPVEYRPTIEWEMAHNPTVHRMSFVSSDGKVKWNAADLEIGESSIERGVAELHPKKFIIQPQSKKISYKSSGKFALKLVHGYWVLFIGTPTLSLSIRVTAPDDYEVSATSADVETHNYWQYNSIRMRGDHITLRWRKKDGPWL